MEIWTHQIVVFLGLHLNEWKQRYHVKYKSKFIWLSAGWGMKLWDIYWINLSLRYIWSYNYRTIMIKMFLYFPYKPFRGFDYSLAWSQTKWRINDILNHYCAFVGLTYKSPITAAAFRFFVKLPSLSHPKE